MSNDTRDNKNPSVGSIYFNVMKGTTDDIKDKLKKAVKWLQDQKVFLSVSLKQEGDGDYTKYTAFFNSFKKKDSEPDMKIKAAGVDGGGEKKQETKKATDDIPF